MNGTLKVTPEKLISTSSEFSATGKQITSLTNTMLQTVNSLKSQWQGEASTAYANKFNALQDDMQKMDRMIQEHVTDLNDMAKQYQTAENLNMQNSNALPADVIS